MNARRRDLGVVLALSALVAVLAYPCARCAYNLSYATLGRDTGIYQFVAWAIHHGQRPYVDIRENNGPFVYVEHLVALALGGRNEHVFRTFDIVCQCAAYAVAGVVAAGPWSREARASLGLRALFGALGVLALFSQYVVYDWWATAQRESSYDAALLIGLSLQLAAHQRLAVKDALDRVGLALFAAGGAFVASTVFGKPTYAVCSMLQAGCVLIDPNTRRHARRALLALVGGAAAMSIAFLLFIVAIGGDVVSYVRIVAIEAPRYYVPIWKQKIFATYSMGHNGPMLNQGFAAIGVLALLLATRRVPRSLFLATIPVTFGILSFFAQRKGFYYHLHPVTCGAYWIGVLLLGWFAERARLVARPYASGAAAVALFAALGWQCFGNARYSDFYRPKWMPAGASTATRETRSFYESFDARDFDGWDVRQAADYVASHTKPSEAVQTYGLEPYILFLARRRTATPFIFLYDLNMDPALEGGPGGKPDAAAAAEIVRLQERNAKELYDGLVAAPPGAFVLVDHAPMAYAPDALKDFLAHCPDAARWMTERYTETARFGTIRVFLPR